MSEDKSVNEVPPHLVQIFASRQELNDMIESFVKSRREVINLQNIKEFCLPLEQRSHCARVDAVLVKRKDTSSHIRVEHVENLWGPQIKTKECLESQSTNFSADLSSQNTCPSLMQETTVPISNKKVYSTDELDAKLFVLKQKLDQNNSNPP